MCATTDLALSGSPTRSAHATNSCRLNIVKYQSSDSKSCFSLSITAFFESLGISNGRFVQQILQPLAILNRFGNLGR
jgi:hypothetical protein